MKVSELRRKLSEYPDDAEASAFHALLVIYVEGRARPEDHLLVTYGQRDDDS